MCFYDILSKLCAEKHITISRLLVELEMSASNKQKWQNGATVNSAALIKIADNLDCSVDYLLGRTDNPDGGNHIQNDNTTINGTQANVIQGGSSDFREIQSALSRLPGAKRHRAIADILDLLEEKYQ